MGVKQQKRILIVSDGKRGHVHQTTGVVHKLRNAAPRTLEIAMKKGYYLFLVFVCILARRARFSDALILFWLQKITAEPVELLLKYRPHIVISAGSLTHPVTFLLGRLWGCPTVVCMRPSLLRPSDFDLVVAPRHDARRCRGDNVLYTMGATSNISDAFIFAEGVALRSVVKEELRHPVGLLVGGNSAINYITRDMAVELASEMLLACEEIGCDLLATTSRRTPPDAEKAISDELAEHDRCKYLLLASRDDFNPVPGIIGVCDVVVVTEDTVSMVSEIITGGKYAVVVQVGKRKKRNKFIALYEELAAEKYITYTTVENLNPSLVQALSFRAAGMKALDESRKVAAEIERRFFTGEPGTEVKR